MRDDMHKQITECGRYKYSKGWRNDKKNESNRRYRRRANQKVHQGAYDSVESKESIKGNKVRDRGFEFGENLSPLFRWLEAQVGRPWDKVYSELRGGIPEGTMGDHVLLHADWHVELNCFHDESGAICRPDGSSLSPWRGFQLYVAEDGILRKLDAKKARKRRRSSMHYDVCRFARTIHPKDVHHGKSRDVYDFYRRKAGRWEKAVLYDPDTDFDIPNGAPDIFRCNIDGDPLRPRWGEPPKPIYKVKYWTSVSGKQVRSLGLDDVDLQSRSARYGALEPDPMSAYRASSEPLSDNEFREILRRREQEAA